MSRSDISTKVIHFTKGDDDRQAFNNLLSIIDKGRIVPGTGMIKGKYSCVCFTEAPLSSLSQGLVHAFASGRYKQFGIMFEKSHVFQLGGRPVIYQSSNEINDLHEEIRWRHVRYEPAGNPPVDFTWEREWRLKNEIQVSPEYAQLIVPTIAWLQELQSIYEYDQVAEREYVGRLYSLIMDENIAEQYASAIPQAAFPWTVNYF
jgi:hypothetical protein